MKAEFVDIGNINNVYKLEVEGNIYFMKHYGNVRRETEGIKSIGDLGNRCQRERDAIKFYREHLNPDYFPDIVYEGKDLTVFTSIGDKSLQDILVSDDYDNIQIRSFQQDLANMLQKLHSYKIDFNDKDLDRRFYKFRTASNPEAINIYNENDLCAIVGDLNPRQIFLREEGFGSSFGLCDFEFAGMGLPGYDIGFYLANLHIMNYVTGGLDTAIEDFTYRPKYTDFFIGTSILNRVEGVPLEPYIKEFMVPELKSLAEDFIARGKEEWD